MTTTAFDDQFVSATETILALNVRDECQQVHDLQVRLAAAIQRDTDAEAELAQARQQKPLTWGTSGELMEILKNPIYSSPAPVPAVAAPAVPEDYRQALVEIALRCTDHDATDAIDALLQSGSDPVAHHPV